MLYLSSLFRKLPSGQAAYVQLPLPAWELLDSDSLIKFEVVSEVSGTDVEERIALDIQIASLGNQSVHKIAGLTSLLDACGYMGLLGF